MTTKTENKTEDVSFPKRVWATMSRVDVGDHIETAEVKSKEGRVIYTYQYLGWAWAWAQFMSLFPESDFDIGEEERLENGSVMVNVQITVREGENELTRRIWLPVMDQKNNSVLNPTTRQVSDSRMRALVKCLAMGFGFGLDLWTGSDMPVGTVDDFITAAKLELLTGLFDKLDETSQAGFLAWMEVEKLEDITEGRYQSARKQLERKVKALK